ncbi:MAG: ATP-binding protein [Paratractidigestivibacter faecalis]|uniref:ATP-binding protein n=1 Tax=Paratractidigestivibacter faecalis TaxID=2292441 RepID=UPI0026EECB17|nr:ATP-binding protein [Paratractidigestivibacter faecalis]MDD6418413.1 ATP-binding protein [Paratractidigestivibacter faecalis]
MEVSTPARIAVYDDAAAAPRVVMVEPKDVRSFLEEITATVNRLSHEQGGTIPFMVIREIVENFIHAYFKAPTITILDGGNTIRFSDQGPGIKQKDLALEYGTSSATEEMKHYIRGVGSGLPYAQQYMVDKGGSLDIEDNLGGGTVVTISTHPREDPPAPQAPMAGAYGQPYQQQWPQQPQPLGQAYGQQWPAQPWQQPCGQQTLAGTPQQQQQTGWQQSQPYGLPWQQQAPAGMPTQQQPWQQAAPMGQPAPQQPYTPMAGMPAAAPQLNERSQAILGFLSAHELCGPTDLANALGGSNATWSRALQDLAGQGVVIKDSQKYRLTSYGQSLIG